jgi:hypothetical protein
MKKTCFLIFALLLVSAFVASGPAWAEEKESDKKSPWEFSIMPYMSTVGVNGTVGVDHKTTQMNVPWNKFKHYIQSGYALALEVRNDRHAVFFNGTYLKLDDDGTLRNEKATVYVDATLQISNMELAYSYRLAKEAGYAFDVFAGARYWRFKTDLDVVIPVAGYQNSYSDTEQWVDPIIGFVFKPALTKNLSLMVRGDVGGFGVGSHFTWKGWGAFNYQFTRNIGGQLGYSYTSLNYSKNGFTSNIDMQGAYGGIVFRF